MNKNVQVMLKSVFVNIILVITKFLIGILGNSTALVADGVHSLSDLATDIVAIVCAKLSDKPADKEHPYGHGKIEYICCIFISILVLLLGCELIYNAFNSRIKVPSVIVIYATIVTIILKYLLSSYILAKGKEYNSTLLLTSGQESRTDVYSSLIVFIAAILSQFSNQISIFKYADFGATLVLGVFILIMGLKMLSSNLKIILGAGETNEELISALKSTLRNYPEINSYNNLNVIRFGSYYKCDLTVFIDEKVTVGNADKKVEELKKQLREVNPQLKYLNIVIKPYKNGERSESNARDSRS
jgi:cation diffusion facilitator family transporter